MIINLPFEIGQKMYTLSDDNKAIEFTIVYISVSVSAEDNLSYANYYNKMPYEPNALSRKDYQLYHSVEELKESIFGEIER